MQQVTVKARFEISSWKRLIYLLESNIPSRTEATSYDDVIGHKRLFNACVCDRKRGPILCATTPKYPAVVIQTSAVIIS